jgi:hypothetical protein
MVIFYQPLEFGHYLGFGVWDFYYMATPPASKPKFINVISTHRVRHQRYKRFG